MCVLDHWSAQVACSGTHSLLCILRYGAAVPLCKSTNTGCVLVGPRARAHKLSTISTPNEDDDHVCVCARDNSCAGAMQIIVSDRSQSDRRDGSASRDVCERACGRTRASERANERTSELANERITAESMRSAFEQSRAHVGLRAQLSPRHAHDMSAAHTHSVISFARPRAGSSMPIKSGAHLTTAKAATRQRDKRSDG